MYTKCMVGVGLVSPGIGWYGMDPDRPSSVATGGRSCYCCKEHPLAESEKVVYYN